MTIKTMRVSSVVRFVSGLLPIVQWSKEYGLETGVCDLVAGVTVALTLVPQSIAYASLAGFEPQYGLYASFAGSFVYALLGACPQINIGPTALLSLLTFTYTSGVGTDFAVLLCFVGGFVQLLAGIAQLGFLVDFVSMPVVSGFTSAAAVTIASSQVKGLLGLNFKAESFMSTWREVFLHIGETRLADTLLSVGCCVLLFGMKALKDIKFRGAEKSSGHSRLLQRALWLSGVGRNATVVVLAALVAYCTFFDGASPFILTGKITAGLPIPQMPAFRSTVGNVTYSPTEMLARLGSGLLVVPLVGIIANVAIAKAFSNGKTLDATQEIIALGLCNVVGAFFRSFPVNGSFTRSAVSQASGVRTPAAGFYTGIIVILTLVLLTPYFYFIPRAALAAVIVCAVLHMVDVAIVAVLWRTSRLDLIPLFGTFVLCLALGIELGLGCGVAIDVLLLLYYNSRPALSARLLADGALPPHYAAHPTGGLHFAGADRVRAQLSALPTSLAAAAAATSSGAAAETAARTDGAAVSGEPLPLVLYCDALSRIDYTSLQSMKSLVQDCRCSQRRVLFYAARAPVLAQLQAALGQELLSCATQSELRLMLSDPVNTSSQAPLQQICLDSNHAAADSVESNFRPTTDTRL